MEAQQQQQQNNNQQQQQQNEDGGSGKAANFLCRQSSTRWTPTTDQIRILKDLYYNNGVRSPNAEQIQRISARLRQYGKIEGKNVFYWFQNHKARERQKKRFTAEIPVQRSPSWRSHHDHHQDPIYTKYPHNLGQAGVPSPSSSSSSPGVLAVGQMGNYGYGPVTMEKSFRDCSISAGGSVGHSFWVGADHPYSSSYNHFFDKRNSTAGEIFPEEEQELEQEDAPEIETLPLFPMHGEDMPAGFCSIKSETETFSGAGCYNSDYAKGRSSRTSLELSLNSYIGGFSDST